MSLVPYAGSAAYDIFNAMASGSSGYPKMEDILRKHGVAAINKAASKIGRFVRMRVKRSKKRKTHHHNLPTTVASGPVDVAGITVSTLDIVDLTSLCTQGSDPGQRRYNKFFIKGVELLHVIQNQATDTAMVYHYAIATPKYIHETADYNKDFFTDPATETDGRGGIDFDDITLNPTDRNIIPMNSLTFKIYTHRSLIMSAYASAITECGALPTLTGGDDTVYVKRFIPINSFFSVDPDRTNFRPPLLLFTWVEPLRRDKSGANVSRSMYNKVYLKG